MEYPPRQSDTFVYHPTTAQFTAASSTSYAKQILSPASDSPSPSPSPQPSANENSQRITRINFLHFDQECDFGVETESGQRVRKRKRPGRKPNPPSLQERRAQNRAAQRAFREREQLRKQEKEREWRAQAEEIAYLRKRLEQVEYEANYLRGYVLLLTLSGLVERGSVPHVWTDTRWFHAPWDGSALPPDIHQDNLDELPAILQTVLNRDSQILSFADAVTRAERHGCKFSEKRVPFPVTKPSEKRSDDMEELLTSNTASESMVSAFTATKPVVGTITECPTLKTPDDLAHMPSLQALHILRLQLKSSSVLGDKFRLFFTPSKKIQRNNSCMCMPLLCMLTDIRHSSRIATTDTPRRPHRLHSRTFHARSLNSFSRSLRCR